MMIQAVLVNRQHPEYVESTERVSPPGTSLVHS